MGRVMKVLAIDTSCDETSAAVTEGGKILSNVVWSQIRLHAKWGGVVPGLAQRAHEERIDAVVDRALKRAKVTKPDILAVTVGPGLAIALGVGISKAKALSKNWRIPLVPVNHVEAHLLSPLLSQTEQVVKRLHYPAMGLVVSGGHTEVVSIEKEGVYRIVGKTLDDAVGEALDKAARMLGLGYPGGALLEKFAKFGDMKHYSLPLPMAGKENSGVFSYSGLKTAMWRLVSQELKETNCGVDVERKKIFDLAATFQDKAFSHLVRIVRRLIILYPVGDLLVGGGVAANNELRKRLRRLETDLGLRVWFPNSKVLCGDNAAMIGFCGEKVFERSRIEFQQDKLDLIDRQPRLSVEDSLEKTFRA